MSSTGTTTKATGIETHITAGNGSTDIKAMEEFETSPSETRNGVGGLGLTDEETDREALASALQEIEGRKTKWYAYLTTKDFYAVLVLG